MIFAFGCEEVPLRAINRTISLDGTYCTNESALIGVPIRILLIVDTSESMRINDPDGNRGKAAARLVNGLHDKGMDVSFGFVHFDTGAVALTNGFLKDRQEALNAISGLNLIQGFTNYLDALGAGKTMINQDIVKTREELKALEEMGISTKYKRPWYFVIFLSDGIPRMPGGVLQDTNSILFQVDQLVEVPKEATGVTLHTAFLGAQDDVLRPEAEVLLKKMAANGQGMYFSFENGEEIDFSVFDFQIKRLYDIKQVIAYNRSSVLTSDDEAPLPDSDQDGLADEKEKVAKTDPKNRDTDADGLNDGYEVRMALDPLKENAVCSGDQNMDTDKDGLNDCEENFLNLMTNRFDTDGDLFPDQFELISGSNPGDPQDADEDLDFDNVLTGAELRTRTKVNRNDGTDREYYAFTYSVEREFKPEKGAVCYKYSIGNVGVVKTLATAERAAGINEVVMEVVESPEDAPDRIFSLNRFVFQVDYKNYEQKSFTTESKFDVISNMEIQGN